MWIYSLLLLTVSFVWTTRAVDVHHGQALVAWLREQEKGFFHESLEIRRHEDDDNSSYGMYATADVKAQETLLVLPRQMIVDSGGSGETCDTARNLIKQLKLGNESIYAPYINYLLDQKPGQLPSAWSEAGQELLMKVVGSELPPEAPETMTSHSFARDCGGNDDDPLEFNAYMMLLQRGWDDLLLPIYDMMSHGNGKWLNTETTESVHDQDLDTITVRASRDIAAGEQIYTTYDMCMDCGLRWDSYGTPQMLRDYGFVEQYPQRWIIPFFDFPNVAFRLEEVEDNELKLTWIGRGHKREFCVRYLMAHLERIKQVAATDLSSPSSDVVPEHEYDTILKYYWSLVTALEMAIEEAWLAEDAQKENEDNEKKECTVEPDGTQTCPPAMRKYDDLAFVENELDFTTYQCFEGRSMEFPDYDDIEYVNSHYQRIHFFQHPENKDTCFRLDGTVQICGSVSGRIHSVSDATLSY